MPACGIDTSIFVRLLTGLPAADYQTTVNRLTSLRSSQPEPITVASIVVAEAYAVLQHHYRLGKTDARAAILSVLTSGLIEGLLFQTMIQGTGLALLELTLKAHGPVLVNDSICGIVEVEEVKPTSKNNRAVVTSRIDVLNQRDERVLSYTAKRLLAGRPA